MNENRELAGLQAGPGLLHDCRSSGIPQWWSRILNGFFTHTKL